MRTVPYLTSLAVLLAMGIGLSSAWAEDEPAAVDIGKIREFHKKRAGENDPLRLKSKDRPKREKEHPRRFTITVTGPKGKVVLKRKVTGEQLKRLRTRFQKKGPRRRGDPFGPDEMRKRLREHMKDMPPEARGKLRRRLKNMTPEQRRKLFRRLMNAKPERGRKFHGKLRERLRGRAEGRGRRDAWMEKLAPEQRKKVRKLHEQQETQEAELREKLHEQMKELRERHEQERKRLRETLLKKEEPEKEKDTDKEPDDAKK